MPEPLNHIVTLTTTYHLDERIRNLFTVSFEAVNRQLIYEKRFETVPGLPLLCIITQDDTVHLQLGESFGAGTICIAHYCTSRWDGYSDAHICAFIIEELCHHIWVINNEVNVKFKVIDILRLIFPKVALNDIYSLQALQEDV